MYTSYMCMYMYEVHSLIISYGRKSMRLHVHVHVCDLTEALKTSHNFYGSYLDRLKYVT